jgi:hypothetical protein
MIFLLMLTVYGMGFQYNNIYRMGSIFPSDLVLLLVSGYYVIKYRNVGIKKTYVYAFLVAMVEFCIGIMSGSAIGNILRDVKIFLYFFAIYLILKGFCDVEQKIEKLYKYYAVVVVLSVALNIINFFSNGLANIDQGEILRTFAIGLGWGAVVPISLIANTFKSEIGQKYGVVVYYTIEIVSIVCVALSCTRTAWISFIVAFSLKRVFVDKISINVSSLIKASAVVILVVLLIGKLYQDKNPVFMVLYNRFAGITEAISDDDSTFAYRLNDVSSSFYKFESPRIICGYGFGDTRKPYGYRISETDAEVGCENSYFYYVWKYGILFSVALAVALIKKINRLWNQSKVAKVWTVYLIVYMAIGAMSGNLSNTYSIAIYALYFILADYANDELELIGLCNSEN